MSRTEAEIFIAGGGIAGLTAALAFGRQGRSVVLATPEPPVTAQARDGSDLRSTAFLQPAVALFEQIGLWPQLAEIAVPLRRLRIVDTTGQPPVPREDRVFDSTDLELEAFGWNVINWRTSAALLETLALLPHVDLRFGTTFSGLVPRRDAHIVRLSTGDSVRARLVVGADGRNSAVRQATGIAVETHRTGQIALACTVTHPIPHEETSTELYHEGGPFTLVPLPDGPGGSPASALVWMNPAPEALRLAELPTEAFNAEMSARSCHWFGPLSLASPVRRWPIISQRSEALIGERVALIAEAAHVMPPIGAQGLNTSLQDVGALLEATQGKDPGSIDALMTYSRARHLDVKARVAAIDVFNRVTRAPSPALQALRLAGLRAVYDVKPIRQAVMRAGLGAKP